MIYQFHLMFLLLSQSHSTLIHSDAISRSGVYRVQYLGVILPVRTLATHPMRCLGARGDRSVTLQRPRRLIHHSAMFRPDAAGGGMFRDGMDLIQ